MNVKFWGTRGSLAKPGPDTARYGGNTSCVEVHSSRGTLIILDCGTGAHGLGQSLLKASSKGVRGHILISHTHWDHIQGLPFFAPLFIPGNEWDIYGPKGLDQSIREALAGQMQHTYFPVGMDQFGATVRYHDLVEGEFEIDDVRVLTRYLNHPALTLGYRIEADRAVVVYSCDHELHSSSLAAGVGAIGSADERHAEFLRGADLVLHDAQYTAVEYPNKIGWGHSTAEYAVRMAQHADVVRIGLTHHDPLRTDSALDQVVEDLRAALRSSDSSVDVFAAAEGMSIEVEPRADSRPDDVSLNHAALAFIDSAPTDQLIVLAVSDPQSAALLSAAAEADQVPFHTVSDPAAIPGFVQTAGPSLVILEHCPPRVDGVSICRAIRSANPAGDSSLPVILLADCEDRDEGQTAGVTEWLIRPFTSSYLRARINSWILRRVCQWVRAPIPEDEQDRLRELKSLCVLDTRPEVRFDRLTRLAAATFSVPIALVSLVDWDRQWFKSAYGLDARETSRDVSFCAHSVASRRLMIVPDTLRDPRFADNPLVTNAPRIRFYAGAPLILDSGKCVGTLCLIDRRVRSLDSNAVRLLEDFRDLAVQELQRTDLSWLSAQSTFAL